MERRADLREVEGSCRFTAELCVQSHAARTTDHAKQSENEELESAMRFVFLAHVSDGIHLSLSGYVSPERCALTALKSTRNTPLRSVK